MSARDDVRLDLLAYVQEVGRRASDQIFNGRTAQEMDEGLALGKRVLKWLAFLKGEPIT